MRIGKYYYIVVRMSPENGPIKEYPILRYGENIMDALSHAYPNISGCEPILAREATEFEIEGKAKGAFLL